MMIWFREKQDPITQDEFNALLEEHNKFINSGGAGGKWKAWVTDDDEKKGIVFGVYLGPEGYDGKQIDLSYNNLKAISLESITLTYANLVGILCRNQNLKKIDLTGSFCIDSDFTGSNFEGADLTKVDFSRSLMRGCNLKNAILVGTDFENTDLTDADLTGAIVTPKTSFKNTILKNAVTNYKMVKRAPRKKTKKSVSHKTKKIGKTSTTSYKTCSICKTIPDSCYAYWKGGVLETQPLPNSESKLKVVGAPIYNDSTSHSHSVIKRCPECGTCYRWDYEYEYLVNGSEDEITLTRLTEKEAKREVKKIIREVRMRFGLLRAKGVSKSKLLGTKLSNKELFDIAFFFENNQAVYGFDISYMLKYLVNALINHTHVKKDCAGSTLLYALNNCAEKNERNNAKILNLLLNAKTKIDKPEVKELIKDCKLRRIETLTSKVKVLEEELKSENLEIEDCKRINHEVEELYKKIQELS